MKMAPLSCTAAIAALAFAGSADAADFTWRPQLSVGRWWVVKTVRAKPAVEPGLLGMGRPEDPGGFWYTRFRVTRLEKFAGGAGLTLEISSRRDSDPDFEAARPVYEMAVMLPEWRVRSVTRREEMEEPETKDMRRALDPTYRAPFCWPFAFDIEPTLEIVLPVLYATQDGTAATLASVTGTGWPVFRQVVTLRDDGSADVMIENEDCPQVTPTLRFTASAPWYEVVGADGRVIQPIVETGDD